MTKISSFFMTCVLLACAGSASASTDCENAAVAQAFAVDFQKGLNASRDKAKNGEQARMQTSAALQKKVIDAGAWTPAEAKAFIANLAITDPAAKSSDDARAKAAKSLQGTMLAIDGLDFVARNKAERDRGTCIFGQEALSLWSQVDEASEQFWKVVDAKIVDFARSKAVSGF